MRIAAAGQNHCFAEDQPNHVPLRGAEGHPDSNLTCAARKRRTPRMP